jgi:hypothetical protein
VVLEQIPGVTVTKASTAGQADLGVVEFFVQGADPLKREDLIKKLTTRHVFPYSLERTDRPLPESLRRLHASVRKDPHNTELSDHPAVARMLSALALLRGWRSNVRSANSEFAVTPRLDELLSFVETHISLLRKRGFVLEKECMVSGREQLDRKVDEIIHRKTGSLRKLWKGSNKALAAATRALEAPAFDYQIAELLKIAGEAEIMEKKIAKRIPRAAVQHRMTAAYARKMAEMLTKARGGLSIRR